MRLRCHHAHGRRDGGESYLRALLCRDVRGALSDGTDSGSGVRPAECWNQPGRAGTVDGMDRRARVVACPVVGGNGVMRDCERRHGRHTWTHATYLTRFTQRQTPQQRRQEAGNLVGHNSSIHTLRGERALHTSSKCASTSLGHKFRLVGGCLILTTLAQPSGAPDLPTSP